MGVWQLAGSPTNPGRPLRTTEHVATETCPGYLEVNSVAGSRLCEWAQKSLKFANLASSNRLPAVETSAGSYQIALPLKVVDPTNGGDTHRHSQL